MFCDHPYSKKMLYKKIFSCKRILKFIRLINVLYKTPITFYKAIYNNNFLVFFLRTFTQFIISGERFFGNVNLAPKYSYPSLK